MRLNHFIFLISVLGMTACNCDAEIVCGEGELQVRTIAKFRNFSLSERENLRLLIFTNSTDSLIGDFSITNSLRNPNASVSYEYEPFFPFRKTDLRTQYWVFKTNNFTDTIQNFYYEPQDTILSCGGGCNNSYSGVQSFTILENFYFIHQNDTIRDGDEFIIEK